MQRCVLPQINMGSSNRSSSRGSHGCCIFHCIKRAPPKARGGSSVQKEPQSAAPQPQGGAEDGVGLKRPRTLTWRAARKALRVVVRESGEKGGAGGCAWEWRERRCGWLCVRVAGKAVAAVWGKAMGQDERRYGNRAEKSGPFFKGPQKSVCNSLRKCAVPPG